MKILVADKISATGVAKLREDPAFEVIEAYGSTPEQILELAKDVSAIIVRSETKVTADVIQAAPLLRAVGRAGVGVDNIDIEAATDRGVVVMNTPGGNTIATAELAFTHLLCSARPVVQASASVTAGEWNRKAFKGTELNHKTLGILGLGRIGAEVARRAQAFNMTVLAYDPYLTQERAQSLEVEKVAKPEDLFERADFITIHMPKTESTSGMINAEAFARMKDGVRIVNCARGGIIVEADLAEALRSGKVAAAGLDVFEKEPLAADSPLREFSNLVKTPHLGASTEEAQENVGLEIAENIALALKGEVVRNAINMPSVDPRTLKILRPYLVLGEKLGTVLQQVTPDQIDKITISYWGKIVDLDAMPLTRSIQRGYLKQITEHVNDVNAPRCMKRLGINVEVIKSSTDSDYTELVRLDAVASDGTNYAIAGTLIGKSQRPRIVHINGRDVEASPEKYLLVLENQDIPGIVGMVGTALAKYKINIANMSLGRNAIGGIALNIIELDEEPDPAAIKEISSHDAIVAARLVRL